MRDALSLLDQAIAYGGGEVRDAVVRTMLGAVDTEYVYRIVDALVAGDGPALLAEADAMAARSIAFASALDDLASLFHRIAVAQVVPGRAEAMDDAERVAALRRLAPEMVQLAYQICVQGRADLALAPDEATGFAMTLLRLLAFEPGGVPGRAGEEARREPVRRGPVPDAEATAARAAAVATPRAAARAPPATAPTATPLRAPMAAPVARRRLRAQGPRSRPPASRCRPIRPHGRRSWPPSALPPSPASSPRRPSSVRSRARARGAAGGARHLTDKAYADKLQAALDEATGGQAAAHLRARVRRRGFARGTGAARARRAEGEDRSCVPRRAVRARSPRPGSTRKSSRTRSSACPNPPCCPRRGRRTMAAPPGASHR